MAAPTCVITSVKQFLYRGANEEWSNTYMFDGPTPSDATAWRALFDALNLIEKPAINDNVQIVKAYGYDKVPVAGTAAVWSVDLRVSPNTPVSCTLAVNAGELVNAGDSAVWIRWGLDKLNSKGKRVYLRKYYHPAIGAANTARDQVSTAQKNALALFGGKLRDGTFIGGRKLVGPDGTETIGVGVSNYVTTRTLKRRGKRPGA